MLILYEVLMLHAENSLRSMCAVHPALFWYLGGTISLSALCRGTHTLLTTALIVP